MLKYIIELMPTKEDSVTLSSSEWTIIVMLNKYPDFNRLISELKKNYNMSVEEIKASLGKLQKRNILKLFQTQVAENTDTVLEAATASVVIPETPVIFWERLENELSKAIGPIASIVIDDAVTEFNIQRENFPAKFLYSLVEKVAAEIHSHAEKTQFQKAMLEVIKQI
ncbi:MAG: hypothetical protein HQK70_00665 [Desulfamplus sp.]|nr:hypothetical protein [Desulfamplus sp.]